ncbi:uncharacterized protein LOC126769180 [Nymphalis io]|uniref:uncharacterized protein LOC126769180 n=1 Tax=Inachis io TaxID=171585 RepID=UPI00216954DC|nr:uncharacterized protein LOC126769180 [Nymphalis io]
MKHQKVSVDFWAMFQTMFSYGVLTILCFVMIRLMQAVYLLPQRLKRHQEKIENTLTELQTRFPDLNITAKDLEKFEKEMDEPYDREIGEECDELNVDAEEGEDVKPEENKKDD